MDNNEILNILTLTKEYVSGQALAEQLGVSRQAVWKEIRALRARGFEIESVTNRGYRLTAMPAYLNVPAVNEGCKSGTTVAAREQKSGKGRLGRAWQSKCDENIAFSVLLRPKMAPSEVACITPLAGLAVCKALRKFTGLDCRIKWPNDVIVGNKKLVGILTEMSAEFDAVEYIVTGIGVNVDQEGFPEEIAGKATSLYLETGRHFDKNALLACLLNQLEEEFLSNNLELSPTALEEYAKLCATLGKNVGFSRGGSPVHGVAVGVDENGELEVMLPDGSICMVNSGEVTAQGIY